MVLDADRLLSLQGKSRDPIGDPVCLWREGSDRLDLNHRVAREIGAEGLMVGDEAA
jgi:hypothetical protein